ncbi:MAG TPA: CAP domain-containing protein [Myxococcota bacterium]|jgi:hypothetical protein
MTMLPMTMLPRMFALGFAVACTACGAPSAFKDADVDEFVAEHNAIRAAASPAPSTPLGKVSWDNGLESTAQGWAGRCVFEHSHGPTGENIAYFSGTASTPKDVVDAWAAEVADYDLGSNTCAADKECGHYTQIVWRDSTAIGCGASSCHMFDSDGIFWVCEYNPPGNVIGSKPY